MSESRISYRPEIDGLRALCVLAVILFHAGLGLPGGFVGVDVFFVISGYLITSIIYREMQSGSFSLVAFWERRIRRIYPAVAFVQAVVLVMGFFLYLPAEYKDLSQASLFLSASLPNLFYWQNTDYFTDYPILKPLLHTWSLGVEEQFYIVFPLLMAFLYNTRPTRMIRILRLLAVFSFGLNIFLVFFRDPSAGFYLLPSRAWELMAGCFLALANPVTIRSPRSRELVSVAGLAIVVLSMLLFRETMRFPGLWAIIPVAGAYLFIAANSQGDHQTRSAAFMSHATLVTLGKMSFSLYLWHWPLIAFSRLYFIDYPQICLFFAAMTFPIAFLAWRYVEGPIRQKSLFASRRAIFSFFILTNLAMISFSATGLLTNGHHERLAFLPDSMKLALRQDFSWNARPVVSPRQFLRGERATLGDTTSGPPRFLLWGDSHAYALTVAFDRICRENQVCGYVCAQNGLNVIPKQNQKSLFYSTGVKTKREDLINFFHEIRKEQIQTVFLASRWGKILDYPGSPEDVQAFLELASQTCPDVQFYILDQIPQQNYRGQTYKYQAMLSSAFSSLFPYRCTSQKDYDNLQKNLKQGLTLFSGSNSISNIDLKPQFFDDYGLSRYQENGRYFYSDDNHISNYGVERLLRPVIENLVVSAKSGYSGRMISQRPSSEISR